MGRSSGTRISKPKASPVRASGTPLFSVPVFSTAPRRKPTVPVPGAIAAHNFADIPLFSPDQRSVPIQAKLSVGKAGDKYEQEADKVADQVIRMPEPGLQRQEDVTEDEEDKEKIQAKPLSPQITPLIQRQTDNASEEDEEETLQAKPLLQRQEGEGEKEEEETDQMLQASAGPGQAPAVSAGVASGVSTMQGGGQALSPATRAFMEPRFAHDFSKVRIHADRNAANTSQQINARAFTVGRNIAFGAGQYQPDTSNGRKLLAHELTHVVQQGHASSVRSPASGQQINRSAVSSIESPTIQASFISFAIKMGAKRVAKGILKNFIKTQIKGKIKKLASKKFVQRFAREADDLIGILEDPWWATAIGFIPVVGDAFDLARVPKQIAKAMRKADKLEAKIKKILKIQGKKAGNLISAKLKKSDSYFSDLGDKTYATLIEMAEQGDNRARKMRKLIEEAHRLSGKL